MEIPRKVVLNYAEGPDAGVLGAAQLDILHKVRDMLAQKADPNVRENNNGSTALMCAASTGNLGIVKRLLEAGAEVNLENEKGQTALWRAVQRGHPKIVQLLLEHDASMTVRGNDLSLLAKAAEQGDIEILEALVASGVDFNGVLGSQRQTALMHFALAGNARVVKLLLDAGADPD